MLSEGGYAVPSLIEALETSQAGVPGQAERLREQIAGLSEELPPAEERLSRLRITRETVEEAGGAFFAGAGR
ncbi:hypothetical protein GCM10010269_16010 [Streptomyces humidus]|uniref:Uncharacterized protein n=1 Tax=Streptomyces humidus TaxID=52259 RepID=A0A918FTJ3_9ACTN|nr:hypothetical protein [Streptomyces humidus]GGR77545.1 hypothetical protein GCM10010269_16010 [Streptomyces humidus]